MREGVIEDAEPCAQDGLAVARDVPSNAGARRPVVVIRIVETTVANK